jgi:hypothetical protein
MRDPGGRRGFLMYARETQVTLHGERQIPSSHVLPRSLPRLDVHSFQFGLAAGRPLASLGTPPR